MLYAMRNDLVTLAVEVGNAYPVAGERSKQYAELARAVTALDKARGWLDSRLHEDCPDMPELGHVYYLSSDGRNGTILD